MAKQKKMDFNIGSSIFWILISLIVFSGMIFLSVWAYQNNSVQGAMLALMFSIMNIFAIIFTRFKIFNIGTWSENSLSFTLGFTIWGLVGAIRGNLLSVITTPTNQFFSTVAGEMPQLLDYLMTVFVIPFSEEMFWILGLPVALFTIMDVIAKKWSPAKNPFFQMAIIILVSGISFATFHIGKLVWAFLISAFTFRAVLLTVVWSDMRYDVIKGLAIVASFGFGAHVANNMFEWGFRQGLTLLITNFWTIGWIIFVLFGVIFLSGIIYAVEKIAGLGEINA